MNDIGIGAVGAAIIAGLISLLGLIIGKEQKVSEFRQVWIDELRKCLVAYLVNINAVADAVRVASEARDKPTGIDQNYKLLNEANHGIKLRVNDDEQPSIDLLNSMKEFESLAENNSDLTPKNIRDAEEKYLIASKNLLKFEWKRVKRGEKTYIWTKYIVVVLIALLIMTFAYLWYHRDPMPEITPKSAVEASFGRTVICLDTDFLSADLHQSQRPATNLNGNTAHLPLHQDKSMSTIDYDSQAKSSSVKSTEADPDD